MHIVSKMIKKQKVIVIDTRIVLNSREREKVTRRKAAWSSGMSAIVYRMILT